MPGISDVALAATPAVISCPDPLDLGERRHRPLRTVIAGDRLPPELVQQRAGTRMIRARYLSWSRRSRVWSCRNVSRSAQGITTGRDFERLRFLIRLECRGATGNGLHPKKRAPVNSRPEDQNRHSGI